MKDTN